MTQEERRELCACFDTFSGGWTVENVRKVMSLGFVRLDDITSLRGCWLVTKEDQSVFVDPVYPVDPEPVKSPSTKRQWMLDRDYHGFSFAPRHLMEPYMSSIENHGAKWVGKDGEKITGKLFCHMCNFVASNYGWHTGSNLVPSPSLDVEITKDQVDLLNPTPRDVQLGAILDQCSGKKATKKIARRRIDFVSGNVNSYARILNRPKQLEKITTFNQLLVSIATLQRERDEEYKKQTELKNKKKKETEARAAEKKALAKEKRDQLLPVCMEHVKQGLQHVLDQKVVTADGSGKLPASGIDGAQ